jgi:bacterioferritin-associated ferredoxin
MIVCICHRISDRDIAAAAAGTCSSFEDLQAHTRVATACGACRDCAQQTFDASRPAPDCGHCPGARHCGGVPEAAGAA